MQGRRVSTFTRRHAPPPGRAHTEGSHRAASAPARQMKTPGSCPVARQQPSRAGREHCPRSNLLARAPRFQALRGAVTATALQK